MGFGHRVYKNFDPRAKIIKIAAHEVLKDLGINDPILEIAKSFFPNGKEGKLANGGLDKLATEILST